jgi:hypothetical protein
MVQLQAGYRVLWRDPDGFDRKGTIERVFKNKVRIRLSDLTQVSVSIDDVTLPSPVALLRLPIGRHPLDPNSIDPNSIDPNSIDPNSIDPNSIDPNSIDPNSLDPNSIDPNSIDPNSIDPNSLDPNSLDPNSIDPNSIDLNSKGYEEIKIIKGCYYRYWRWYEGGKKRSKYLGKLRDG